MALVRGHGRSLAVLADLLALRTADVYRWKITEYGILESKKMGAANPDFVAGFGVYSIKIRKKQG